VTFRRLLGFLRPHSWRMAGTIASNVTAAVLDVFSFTLLIPFLDALFGTQSRPGAIAALQDRLIGAFLDPTDKMGSLRNIILVILVAVALKNLIAWYGNYLGAKLQEYITRDLRNAVYRHLQKLPLSYFARTKTGQIQTRVLTDTTTTKQVITHAVTTSIQAGAQVVATIVALVVISWRLTVISLVAVPLRRGHRRLGNQFGDMTSVVQEAVNGIRLVKAFGGEKYEEKRFVAASDQYAREMARMNWLYYAAGPITETVGTAIAIVILWLGARQVLLEGTLTGSTLITFMILVMRLLQPLKQLSQVPTTAQAALAAGDRLFEILDAPAEESRDRGTKTPTSLERDIVFENVGFSYGDQPVLSNISFAARRGDVVALVGPSGAGKSTLVDLIPRFYERTEGRILLDGVDTREISLSALRGLTGIVSQDTVLFNDTVRNNIAYAAGDRFSDEQVMAAARAANAHQFIMELPSGYDTLLGERGMRLSGGQRQRLAIARALLIDPPILILDEATSALDTESERLVQEAIERLLEGRTVFVIAHRLSTVSHASRILVLDRGRIVESGTHDALLAAGGLYARLHGMQMSGAVAATAR
jgi:ATP-binding cassette, subfamily B, bacterial MsbA